MEQSKQKFYFVEFFFFFWNVKFLWSAVLFGKTGFNCYHSCCFFQENKINLCEFLKQILKSHIERRCSQTRSAAGVILCDALWTPSRERLALLTQCLSTFPSDFDGLETRLWEVRFTPPESLVCPGTEGP